MYEKDVIRRVHGLVHKTDTTARPAPAVQPDRFADTGEAAPVASHHHSFREKRMSRKLTSSILALILGMAFSLSALAATPVNINKADAATIAKALNGVGMAKAQAIVKYRKA
ncbi:MAG TPA: helix-hairpin-helix domain-containing protein, partial [Oleiagrimonas sp.]|nr:helix-hairpin-helix domain-containing protein [Oleiagrimonas sp.]